jgi:hypothetical protein
MKVLLQDLESLCYLSVTGRWTTQVEEALDFGEVTRAVDVAFTNPVSRVRVVLRFAPPASDLALPPIPPRTEVRFQSQQHWLPRTLDPTHETVA